LHVAVDNVSDNGQFEAVAADPDHGSVSSAIVDENNPNSDDTVYVKISVDADSATEGGELTYTLTLVDSDGNPVTPPAGTLVSGDLNWSGAAAGGADTSALPNSFTIGDSGSFEFKVDAIDDFLKEGSEELNVAVDNVTDNGQFEAVAADPDHGSVSSAIVDEDNPNSDDTVYVKISVDADSATEGGELTYTLTLVDSDGNSVTPPAGTLVSGDLNWSGAAAGGADTSALPESFTIGDSGSFEFTIDAIDDFLKEGSEALHVAVDNVSDN
ncbi:hypothetical protein DZ860_23845, partial [Vibrio sinensis]